MSYTKTTWVNNTTPINETNLNKIESGIKNNDINIGEENYDNTKTYEVGDIVRYNEKIYKCITAITTAENFDISKWEQTNIVEIVQSEKSKIYELIEALSTPIVGEGENITLNDTAEKRFENFDIEGNSKQEATPSPDYPSEVKSCGDNVNIIDCVSINGYANASGQIDLNASTNYLSVPNMLEANPNTTYTIDFVGYKDGYLLVSEYDESKAFIKRTQYSTRTFTTSSNCRYVFIHLYNNVADAFSTIGTKIKMVKGTRIDGYSPYGQGSINEVICNKNLFNKANEIVGQLINSSGVVLTNESWNTSEYISVKKGSTICWSYETVGAGQLTINEFNDAKSFIKQTFADYRNNNRNELVVTLSNDTSYVRVGYRNDLTCDNLVLEYGNKRSGSREHKSQTYTIPTQQPMRAIGDTRDTFILKENGKWFERHFIARKIFDGTENWSLSSNSVAFRIVNSDGIKASKMLSNYFVGTIYENLYNKSEDYGTALDNGYIYIRNKDISGVNDFKTLLSTLYNAGTPVYVDYILETPLDIECTSEQTEILNQMYIKAKSYKGVTHIYSNDAVSPNCYVEAVKDLTTLIQ